MAQLTQYQPYGLPGKIRSFVAKAAAVTTLLNYVGAAGKVVGDYPPRHVADLGDNLAVLGDIEVWGTAWFGGVSNFVKIDSAGNITAVGGTFSGLILGSVIFAGASGVLSQDNSNLFWDDTNKRLEIGTGNRVMLAPLDITGDATTIEDRHEGMWIRGKTGAYIVQINVRGSRLEIGGGASLDTTPAMSVNYLTGKVGIGMTPDYILDIDAGEIGDNNYDGLRIVDTGWKAVSHPMLEFYNSNEQFNGSLARIYGEIGNVGTNSKLYFAVADSSKNLQDRMVIDKSGNVGIGTASPQEKLAVEGIINVPKASTNGIKVDTTTPTFGFADLLGDQFTKNTGATKPTLAVYNGVVNAWQFSNGDEAFLSYHIPHDYVLGTDIHLHIHWSQNNAGATGGDVDFRYTAIYAKGHNQASGSVFTTTPKTALFTSVTLAGAGLNQYQQHLTEVSISAASATAALFDRDDFEPDGVIELTLEMDANNLTGTPSDPFIHFADIHYQTTGLIGTKNRTPDFYA